jgi:ATP-dependent Clp protease ATP-binding subunit ClpA
MENNGFIETYGENFTTKKYITNPAIGRDKEIKELILVLLTPDKSAILTGKPGIGKTAIVEGLAYQIQLGNVPDALKGYTIIKIDTQALMGLDKNTGDSRVLVLVNELKEKKKFILFIDEIHTLIGSKEDGALDFANMFKTGLGRGDIKLIGATTTEEYERYILRDKAFLRRFEKVIVTEPTREQAIEILMGTLPKIEYQTGVKMGYTEFIQKKIIEFIVDVTKEYNRVYENQSRYPDVALTLFRQAFSITVFDNRKTVMLKDVLQAINNSKAVYPDVKKKEMARFKEEFKDLLENEGKKEEII